MEGLVPSEGVWMTPPHSWKNIGVAVVSRNTALAHSPAIHLERRKIEASRRGSLVVVHGRTVEILYTGLSELRAGAKPLAPRELGRRAKPR